MKGVLPLPITKWNRGSNSELSDQIQSILDATSKLIKKDGVHHFIRELTNVLRLLKSQAGPIAWNDTVIPMVRAHPVTQWVQECPLTLHSYSRPRGYPGDAGLLDIIYRHADAEPLVSRSSAFGKAVFEFTLNVAACEAVRQRRRTIAQKIDEISSNRGCCEILAVACGHLREAEMSTALKERRIARFVATDQDVESLRVVRSYSASISEQIQIKHLTVRDLLRNKHSLGTFDFIYAAGLYDYLDERTASRLTRRLFDLLNQNGRLLIPNFLESIWELPYMEACMDWHLISRSERQIRAFADEIDDSSIESIKYFGDELNCIGYLELERA